MSGDRRSWLGGTLLAVLLAAPAPAQRLGFSAGLFDVTRSQEAFELGVELQLPARERLFSVVPVLGVGATADDAFFARAGLQRPLVLGASAWRLVPSLELALFEEGNGKDLGSVVEFRSGLELRAELQGGLAVGLGFYHLSNAGIDDRNPGANSLLLRVLLPEWR